jgi:hypothetical protein
LVLLLLLRRALRHGRDWRYQCLAEAAKAGVSVSGLKCKPEKNVAHTFTKSAGPRKGHRGVDLISDALPFGRLWYSEPNAISNAIGYAKFRSRSCRAMIRVYDDAGNVIETHEHAGEFKKP